MLPPQPPLENKAHALPLPQGLRRAPQNRRARHPDQPHGSAFPVARRLKRQDERRRGPQNLRRGKVAPGTEVPAAPERNVRRPPGPVGLAAHEPVGLELVGVGAPDLLGAVRVPGGDLHVGALPEEVRGAAAPVGDDRVLHDAPDAEGVVGQPDRLAVAADEQGARVFKRGDVERGDVAAGLAPHEGVQLAPEAGDDVGPRQDVGGHPERGGDGVARRELEQAGFEPADFAVGEAVLSENRRALAGHGRRGLVLVAPGGVVSSELLLELLAGLESRGVGDGVPRGDEHGGDGRFPSPCARSVVNG